MTRDQYIAAVQRILDFQAECDQLSNAVQTMLAKDDHRVCITFGSNLLKGYIELLEEASGDSACPEGTSQSWLQWWLYDVQHPESRWATLKNNDGGSTHYRAHDAGELFDLIEAWKKI